MTENISVYLLKPTKVFPIFPDGSGISYHFEGNEATLRKGHTLHDMYRLLDCHLVDVITVPIGDRDIDLWVDDEALNNPDKGYSLQIGNPNAPDFMILAGSVLFASSDEEGNTTGLTPEDIQNVKEFINKHLIPDFYQFRMRMKFKIVV